MASDSGPRLVAEGTEWHEGRLLDAHIYINEDETEGCGVTFGPGLSRDEQRRLVQQAATMLADIRLLERPPSSD